MPTSPTPAPTRVIVSTRCFGPFQPGQYVPLACAVFVEDRSFRVSADLSIFGGKSDASGFPACPACGGPPWTVDLDLRVPADMAPGVKTFAVWATDPEGHRADTTASIEIAAR